MKELTQMKADGLVVYQVVIVAIFASVILIAVFAGFLTGREVGHYEAAEETIELDSLRGEIANLHNCLDECTWQGNYTYHKWQEQFYFNVGDTSQALEHARIAKNIGDIHVQQPDD